MGTYSIKMWIQYKENIGVFQRISAVDSIFVAFIVKHGDFMGLHSHKPRIYRSRWLIIRWRNWYRLYKWLYPPATDDITSSISAIISPWLYIYKLLGCWFSTFGNLFHNHGPWGHVPKVTPRTSMDGNQTWLGGESRYKWRFERKKSTLNEGISSSPALITGGFFRFAQSRNGQWWQSQRIGTGGTPAISVLLLT